uniref:Uncharacterized protein n=1 Tax=Arundo donax TaxID=35708 RepID=A0A0A9B8M0_ARUDO
MLYSKYICLLIKSLVRTGKPFILLKVIFGATLLFPMQILCCWNSWS